MLSETFRKFVGFFQNVTWNSTEILSLLVSIASLLVIILAIIIGVQTYKRQLRKSNIEKMISIISSFDLLFYTMEKHFKTWKKTKEFTENPDAAAYWKLVDFTDTVLKMQEVKTLSKIHLNNKINIEINSLLDFLGDIMLISFKNEDLSDRNYKEEDILSSDDFSGKIEELIKKISRIIGIKVSKTPPEDIIKKFIADNYLK